MAHGTITDVSDREPAHLGAARHHLGHALVTVGEGRSERIGARAAERFVQDVDRRAGRHEALEGMVEEDDVAIAARSHERAHDCVGRCSHRGLGELPPTAVFWT